MDYSTFSDALWYVGHILTGSSILLTQRCFPLAVTMVFFGQFITIISRPIGRIKSSVSVKIRDESTIEPRELTSYI
jgi:hypothetical protein